MATRRIAVEILLEAIKMHSVEEYGKRCSAISLDAKKMN